MKENSYNFCFFKGRIALYAILKVMGVKKDDEVILPGFTCIVVPNAIIYLGARPVYVDINPETFNIDSQKIEEKITQRTRAIIAQHTFGIPADIDKIVEIAKKNKLYVIEDSCHAIGSKYAGTEVGTFGDASFFSSQWSKPITTGLGGWAIVNNQILKAKMESIYQEFINPSYKETLLLRFQYFAYSKIFKPSLFWFSQNTYRRLSRLGIALGSSSHDELECKMPEGYKKKMSQWQRNLHEKKLTEIIQIIDHRKWITSLYESLLGKRDIKTVKLPEDYEPIFLRYPILVKNKRKLLDGAKKKNIEIGDWFLSPVHPNLTEWERAGYRKGMCPSAEEVCEHIINLPTHQKIGEKEVDRIVEFIASKQ